MNFNRIKFIYALHQLKKYGFLHAHPSITTSDPDHLILSSIIFFKNFDMRPQKTLRQFYDFLIFSAMFNDLRLAAGPIS